jgi:Voltage-dependent anion channel
VSRSSAKSLCHSYCQLDLLDSRDFREPVPHPTQSDDHETLNCYSIIELGRLAKQLFPATQTLPHVAHAGDVFYIVGVLVGVILWGFAIVWFIIAVIMITISGRFPFNMGWWGFIFPVGEFSLFPLFLPPWATLGNLIVFLSRCFHAPDDDYWRRTGISILQGSLMREFNLFQLEMGHFLTLAFSTLGIDRGMCHHVARDCCRDCATFYYGQDVLCAMPRYEYVSESSGGREDGLERSEDGCSVNFVNIRDLQRRAWILRMTRY